MRPQLISALLLAMLPAMAQLPAPNKAGVAAGHDLFRVKDMDAANKFWQLTEYYDGELIIGPGWSIGFYTPNGSFSILDIYMVWEEVPL